MEAIETILSWGEKTLSDILTKVSPPGLLVITVFFLISVFLVTYDPIWSYVRNIVTVSHEGGHALTAFITGRRVVSVKFKFDTSGETISEGRERGLGLVLTFMGGYTSPALMALGFSFLISHGYVKLTLVIIGVLLFTLLLLVRNIWGAFIVFFLTSTTYALFYATSVIQTLALTFITVFLIVSSWKPVIEMYIERKNAKNRDNDADMLRKLTFLPYHFWVLTFLVINSVSNLFSIIFLVDGTDGKLMNMLFQ